MSGKRSKRLRKQARKELRKQGLTPYGISIRSREAAMLAVRGAVRDRPRFVPKTVWLKLVGFVLPDLTSVERAAIGANLEVLRDVA